MKLAAIAICGVVVCASPAAAQSRWAYTSSAISPYEIHAALRAMHLRAVGRPGWLGRHIAVRAIDGYGQMVRVMLDPDYGNVVSVVPLAAAAAAGMPPHRAYGTPSYGPPAPPTRYRRRDAGHPTASRHHRWRPGRPRRSPPH